MLQGLLNNTSIPLMEQVVNFCQARHTVLAGNLANLSTPGYRVQDLNQSAFQDSLKKIVANRDQNCTTGCNKLGLSERKMREVKDNLKGILFHDDSNISPEHQAAELAKNQSQHNMALAIMTSQMRLVRAAISEQVT